MFSIPYVHGSRWEKQHEGDVKTKFDITSLGQPSISSRCRHIGMPGRRWNPPSLIRSQLRRTRPLVPWSWQGFVSFFASAVVTILSIRSLLPGSKFEHARNRCRGHLCLPPRRPRNSGEAMEPPATRLLAGPRTRSAL